MQNNSARIRLVVWERNCRVARSKAELGAARLETAQLRDDSNGVISEAIAKGEQACATAESMQKKADTTEQDAREQSEKMATEANELQDEYMHFKLQIEVTPQHHLELHLLSTHSTYLLYLSFPTDFSPSPLFPLPLPSTHNAPPATSCACSTHSFLFTL